MGSSLDCPKTHEYEANQKLCRSVYSALPLSLDGLYCFECGRVRGLWEGYWDGHRGIKRSISNKKGGKSLPALLFVLSIYFFGNLCRLHIGTVIALMTGHT